MREEPVYLLPPGLQSDIELITDRLMGETTPDQLAEIRRRSLNNPAFRRRLERFTALWSFLARNSPPPMRDGKDASGIFGDESSRGN